MFSINQALFSGGRKKFNDLISAPSPESEKPFDPGKAAGAPCPTEIKSVTNLDDFFPNIYV
jgi:hypothetical protein